MDQEEVDVVQSLDKDRGITLEDFKLIKMHMANCNYPFRIFLFFFFIYFFFKILFINGFLISYWLPPSPPVLLV